MCRILLFKRPDHLGLAIGRVSYSFHIRLKTLKRYDEKNTAYLFKTFRLSWQIGLDRAFLGFLGQNFFIGCMTGFAGIVYKHIRIGIFWLKCQ